MHRTLLLSTLCTVLSCADATAGEPPEPLIRTSRYGAILALPTPAQIDPLQEWVTVSFPPGVISVEQALRHLLTGSGYRLMPVAATAETGLDARVSDPVLDPALPWLLNQPLPRVHRQLGPMSLTDALGVLGGPAFRPVVDHLHRLITFETTPAYRALAGHAGTGGN